MEKETLDRVINEKGRHDIWLETLKVRRVPVSLNGDKGKRLYFHLPRRESILIFHFRIGELQFLNSRRGEFMKLFGTTKCVLGCDQPDNFFHMRECGRYMTKWQDDFNQDPPRLLQFLKDLERERMERGQPSIPLVYRRFERHQVIKPKIMGGSGNDGIE